MKLSELLETLKRTRASNDIAEDPSVVIAYRDQPEAHYLFDKVMVIQATDDPKREGEIVLIAG